jgi:DNA-binding MarR family transcriptional regulator
MSKQSKSKEFSKKEKEERFEEILDNETRHGILLAIRTFGSMNIKKLAKIMGKTESTIFHHISEMIKKPAVIEIDNEKTADTRGIYYQLSDISRERFPDESDRIFEETIPSVLDKIMRFSSEEIAKMMIYRFINHPELGNIVKKARKAMTYFHNIENFILNGMEQSEQAVLEGLKPKNLNYPLGTHSLLNISMKISDPKHIIEINQIASEFFAKLAKLRTKLKEDMDEKNVKEEDRIDVIYYLFGGEVKSFEFEKDENFDYNEHISPIKEKIDKIYEDIEEE